MKAITIRQPHATAVALRSKRIETRSWSTHYRGPLAIHAGQHCRLGEMMALGSVYHWCGALHEPLGTWLYKTLPFGAIVAVADLVDCRPTDSFTVAELDQWRSPPWNDKPLHLYHWTERQMGDFTPGRFGWVLENIRALKTPVPFKGRQQLFEVPFELLQEVMAA
jgi:hypothetical protein